MQVHDLIEELKKFNEDAEVMVHGKSVEKAQKKGGKNVVDLILEQPKDY